MLYQNPVESIIFEPFVEEETVNLSSFANIYSYAEFVYRGATQALVLTQKNLSLVLTHRDHAVKLRSSRRTCVADHLPLLALPPKAILVGVAAFNSPPDGRPVIAITLIHSVTKAKASPAPVCYLNIYGQRCPNGHDLGAIFSDWQSIQLCFIPFALRHTQLFTISQALLQTSGAISPDEGASAGHAVVHTDLVVTGSDGTCHVFRQWGLPIDTPAGSLGVVGDLVPLLDSKQLPLLTQSDVRSLRPALVQGLPASHTLSYLPIGFRAFPPVWGATIEGQPVLKPLVIPKLEKLLLSGDDKQGAQPDSQLQSSQSQQPQLAPGEPERPSFTASLYQEIRPDSALHPLPSLVGCASPAMCLEFGLNPVDGTRIVVAGMQDGTVRLLVSPAVFPKTGPQSSREQANSGDATSSTLDELDPEVKEMINEAKEVASGDSSASVLTMTPPKTFVAQRVLDGPISAIAIFSSSATPEKSVRQHILLSNLFRDHTLNQSMAAAAERYSRLKRRATEVEWDSEQPIVSSPPSSSGCTRAASSTAQQPDSYDPRVTPMSALMTRIQAFANTSSRVFPNGKGQFDPTPNLNSITAQAMSTYCDLEGLDPDVHVAVASALGYVVVFSCVTRMLLDCATPVLGSDGFGPVTCLCVGDIDGDRRNELILGTATGKVVCFQSPPPYISSVLPRPPGYSRSTQVLARIFDKLVPPLGVNRTGPTPEYLERLLDRRDQSAEPISASTDRDEDTDNFHENAHETLPYLPPALGLGSVPVNLVKRATRKLPQSCYPRLGANGTLTYHAGKTDQVDDELTSEYEDEYDDDDEDDDDDYYYDEEPLSTEDKSTSIDERIAYAKRCAWENWTRHIPCVPEPGAPSPFPLRFTPVWQRETAEPVVCIRLFRRRMQVDSDPFGLLAGAVARAKQVPVNTQDSELDDEAFAKADALRARADLQAQRSASSRIDTIEDGEPALLVVMQQSVQILEANFISTSSAMAGKLTILRQISELEDLLTQLEESDDEDDE